MGLPITMTAFFQVLYIKNFSLFGHSYQSQTPHIQFQFFKSRSVTSSRTIIFQTLINLTKIKPHLLSFLPLRAIST